MSDPNQPTASLDIGRVIQETFAVLGRNFAPFAVLAVLLAGLPQALVSVFGGSRAETITSALSFRTQVTTGFWGGLVIWITSIILQATLIYGAVSYMNERRVSVVDSLRVGLNAFLPLILIAILTIVAFICGLFLFVVPGIMLAVAWCVIVPVYVVERPPLFDSFGRAAALTRGNRWQIFALFILIIIATVLIEIVFGIVGAITGFFTLGGLPFITRWIVLPLAGALSALVSGTGLAVLYVELRRVREGVGPQGLAAIFD
jgi:hypothetical protein